MGRRKLKMELIPEKGKRMLKFKKRKESLMKQIDELTTLCDVKACMIIYGPDQEHRAVPEIYPKNLHETCCIINDYKEKRRDPSKCKSFGLSDLLERRKKEAEKELLSLRKRNMNAKYPTWNDELDSERDPLVLTRLADQLKVKSEMVKSRIDFLKKRELDYQYPLIDMASSSTTFNMQQYNDYAPAPPYMNSHWPAPPPPQPYLNFPMANQNHQSEADNYPQPYMMTNDEGSEYLYPFY